MLSVAIRGVGICGPGLDDWPGAAAVLRSEQTYRFVAMRNLAPSALAPGERRRASFAVRLAIEVASQASAAAGVDPGELTAVFASSDTDSDTIHEICRAIAQPGYPVSPTRFHNSVHNAAAGYWSIAVGSHQPSTSLCAYNDTFAAGLLDAATQVAVEQTCVLLITSDVPAPMPLNRERPNIVPFGCAIVLAPHALAPDAPTVGLEFEAGVVPLEWPLELPPALQDNAASRSLLLLHALAVARPMVERLPLGPDAHLEMRVRHANDQ